MTTLRFMAVEAWHEFRAGCRGPLVAIVFLGLIAYLLLVLLNADYVREMGATDVPRNSPHLVYLMTSGQAVWLIFVWAWLFAQPVVRDRTARLHEVVLAAPVSLPALFAGRYIGALVLGCLLVTATGVGFLLVPPLGAAGLFAPDSVGPQPLFAIGHSLLIFTLPSAAGLGALFLCAAVRTRGVAGPFALAAVLMLVWMVSMVVVRGGDANPVLATVLDPSGFAEAEEQTNLWTPREKAAGVLRMTPPLIANRLVWTLPGLLLLGIVLRRAGREGLVLERASGGRAGRESRFAAEAPSADVGAPPPGPPGRPSWVRVAASEAAWHFALSFRGWGTPLALGLLAAMGVGGSFVHVVLHAEGPLVPRPDLIEPLAVEFFYLVVVSMVAAFVGVMARRDESAGYAEIVDAAPAPLGARVAGRALAAAAVTVVFALTPTLAVWIVTAIAAPDAFSLLDPFFYFGLLLAPALLELCALVLAAHALIRHAGAAHAAGIICAFFVVVNHEMGVVTWPPAEVGVPAHVTLSEFAGWAPWLPHVLAADIYKLTLAAVILALAWLAWPRGTALTLSRRWRAVPGRVIGGAGVLAAAGVVLAVVTYGVLDEQFTALGGYRSAEAETADDAAWEARWWDSAAPFTAAGGEVLAEIDPAARTATARWRLEGVRSASGALHGSLPHGSEPPRAAVDGRAVPVTVAFDHFELPLGVCAAAPAEEGRAPAVGAEGCSVDLEVAVRGEGWSTEGESPWLHPSGVWLRAADLLPTLGHDPDRLLRAPSERDAHGLAAEPAGASAGALAPALGVAPAGDWRWTVTFAGAEGDADGPDEVSSGGARTSRPRSRSTAASGETDGPLDFAAAWWPGAPVETRRGDVTALHGPHRARDAGGVLDDVTAMRACVAAALGAAPPVRTVLQAPREQGATALHGDLLWLPEHEGWDIAGEGFGRWRRRALIAAALAARRLTDEADLRREPGADWLRTGVSGWVGMECVRQEDGADAWLALQERESDRVVEAFGALDAPATAVSAAGDVPWVRYYAPLAAAGWLAAAGPAEAAETVGAVTAAVRAGAPLADALAGAVGPDTAAALLGPPGSSDVLVASGARGVDVEGRRWRWRDGGWEPVAAPTDVTQRFDDGSGARRRIGPVPTTVSPVAPFTLIDAWPSFERTPVDNVWRGGSD